MNKYWKIIILILFALAVALGLLRREPANFFIGAKRDFLEKRQPASDKTFADYYQISQKYIQTQTTKSSATFLAAGDINLSRNVALEIQKRNDINYPFRQMAEVLKSTDFNFANLESPFSPPTKEEGSVCGGVVGGHSLIFGANCDYVRSLTDYNFKILNLANNHALDQNIKGLEYTLRHLDKNGIQHVGAGTNLNEAWKPAVIEQNGVKICFLGASYASSNDNGKTVNNYVARIEDADKLKIQISDAKKVCDFIIASMHAGTEYTRRPNAAQVAFARAAIDYGADMVIGHHPHWVQKIEKFKGKYIFYSLGNFIFDQMWSQETREGLALKIQISKSKFQNPANPNAATVDDLQGDRTPVKLNSIELIPVIIENYSAPRPANERETKAILKKIGAAQTILNP